MNSANKTHWTIADQLNSEEQKMLRDLADGFAHTFTRAEGVIARRLVKKGLVRIETERFSDGSKLTRVKRCDWEFLIPAGATV
jgi:hypothetical protein